MAEATHICLSTDQTFVEDELYKCPKCNEYLCPTCGGEVDTIENYDEAMKEN